MSIESEFSIKWQDFLKTVKSAILLNLKEKKRVSTFDLNNVIKAETLAWLNPNVSKGVYFQNLSKKNPQLGEKFEQILNDLHCIDGTSIKPINSLTVTSILFGVAVLIFGLLYWVFSYDLKISVGGSVLFLLIGAPLGLQRSEQWNQKNIIYKVDEIIQNLDRQGNALRQIVKEIEQEDSPKVL